MCRQCFEPFGKVDRIKKIKDYAFVHFEERDNAVEGGTTQLSIYQCCGAGSAFICLSILRSGLGMRIRIQEHGNFDKNSKYATGS